VTAQVGKGSIFPKANTRCEHRWVFWSLVRIGSLAGRAYICEKCPMLEIEVPFESEDRRAFALEGMRAIENVRELTYYPCPICNKEEVK
jgi:hypothetical protein